MPLFRRNLLFYILAIVLLFPTAGHSETLKVEKFSNPVKFANKISQPINLSFTTTGHWKLRVEPLDYAVRNQDDPNYSIPISRLEITELGGTPISNFESGKVIDIKTGNTNGVNNLNLSLNLKTCDSDRPGVYLADFKFTLVGGNTVEAEDIYSLRFKQDEIASITFSNKVVNLSIDKDKILRKGSSQNLSVPVSLYVSSNKNWKLFIRKSSVSKDAKLTYFVKVLGGDSSVICNLTNEYMNLSENQILLASGKATVNDSLNCLDKKIINIDYLVKGPDDHFIPAGSRSEEFEYRLETEN